MDGFLIERRFSRSHKYKTTVFIGSLNAAWKFFSFRFTQTHVDNAPQLR